MVETDTALRSWRSPPGLRMHPADLASPTPGPRGPVGRIEGVGSGGLRGREEGERGGYRAAGSRGGEGTHIGYRSIHIATVPAHAHPQISLTGRRGLLSSVVFFTAAVWCVPALRVPLVHSHTQ